MRIRTPILPLLCIVLASATAAWAAEPKAVLKGPAGAVLAGADFRLRFSGTVSDQDAVLRQASGPADAAVEVNYDKDGHPTSATLLCESTGRYLFVLIAVGTQEGQPARFAFDTVEVEVESATPDPSPDPGPSPDPNPPSPPPAPKPAPGTPEALGWDYHHALAPALGTFLATAANGTWQTTGDLAAAIRTQLDGSLTAAWAPVAAELTRRFGPTSSEPLDAAKREQIRQFLVGVSGGIQAQGGAAR